MDWRGQDVWIVDTHADSLGAALNGRRNLWTGARAPEGQADFPRLRAGGVALQFFSCWVESQYKPERALPRLLQYIDTFYAQVARDPAVSVVTACASLDEVLSRPQQLGAVLSVEGAEALGTDPAILRILWRLGVRLLSLTWNQRTLLADGAGEDPGGGGLSRAGRAMIEEMNRLHMMVDVSHLAAQGFWDVLEVSREAPIASHSNCQAVAEHRRNLSDGQIQALAKAGGVQGITFVTDFLGGTKDVAQVLAHVHHHLDVVGDDRHLGFGSDFDGVEEPVKGLEDATKWPQLLDALSASGLSDATVAALAGGNYLRVFRERWSLVDQA